MIVVVARQDAGAAYGLLQSGVVVNVEGDSANGFFRSLFGSFLSLDVTVGKRVEVIFVANRESLCYVFKYQVVRNAP
jgi:hypothetical protein